MGLSEMNFLMIQAKYEDDAGGAGKVMTREGLESAGAEWVGGGKGEYRETKLLCIKGYWVTRAC